MNDFVAPKKISNEDAFNIVKDLDVTAFNDAIPFPMREDRAERRLMLYRNNLASDNYKSPTDPTRKTAAFLIGRDQFHGASDAAALIKLALLHHNIDREIINEFQWQYIDVDGYIGQRIGVFDPINATPVMDHGHWMEGVVRARLESEHGYIFDNEALAELNDFTMPSNPFMRVTADGVAMRRDGKRITTEIKAPADPKHDYSKADDIHVFQVNAQAMIAKASPLDFQQHMLHYIDSTTGLLRSFDIETNEEIQSLINLGSDVANEFISAGIVPNLGKVVQHQIPFTPEEKKMLNEKLDKIEVANYLHKNIQDLKDSAVKEVDDLLKSHNVPKDQTSSQNLIEGTNRIKSTMTISRIEALDERYIKEEAKKLGLYDKALVPASPIKTHDQAIEALESLGKDTSDFIPKEFDYSVAAKLLLERGIEREALYKSSMRIFGREVKKVNAKGTNADAKDYSDKMQALKHEVSAASIETFVKNKPLIQVLDSEKDFKTNSESSATSKVATARNAAPDPEPDM